MNSKVTCHKRLTASSEISQDRVGHALKMDVETLMCQKLILVWSAFLRQ